MTFAKTIKQLRLKTKHLSRNNPQSNLKARKNKNGNEKWLPTINKAARLSGDDIQARVQVMRSSISPARRPVATVGLGNSTYSWAFSTV